ncbi:ABC transporter substrate-binding protein [Aurantiacibacter suaedae]|uniref:ABC transporter substrate-binding protein n=1 Tax=Aurantiacibacter suaedae TaxID=2545755 RepID=UPI001F4F638C|nr:helical backbone metal receptor [Aurantiacibacter suaedae]
MSIIRAFSGAWLVLSIAACSAQPADRSAEGRPTIVSLNPCSDAILAELAPPEQLLAISHYSNDPAATSMPAEQVARYRSTSSRAEEIIALAPDLVVTDRFLPAPTRRALEQSGIVLFDLDIVSTVDDSLAQVRALADLAERREEGDALVGRMTEAWNENTPGRNAPISVLLWQEDGIVLGPDSLAAALLEHSGFTLAPDAQGLGYGQYLPLEQVLADPPQLLLTSGTTRALQHPALDILNGTVRAQLDPGLLYCAGPTIPRALARLRQIREGFSP